MFERCELVEWIRLYNDCRVVAFRCFVPFPNTWVSNRVLIHPAWRTGVLVEPASSVYSSRFLHDQTPDREGWVRVVSNVRTKRDLLKMSERLSTHNYSYKCIVHEDIYPKLLRDVRFICHKVKSGPALPVSSIGTPILFVRVDLSYRIGFDLVWYRKRIAIHT